MFGRPGLASGSKTLASTELGALYRQSSRISLVSAHSRPVPDSSEPPNRSAAPDSRAELRYLALEIFCIRVATAEERAAELVVLAARQPTTKLPSGSLVRRGTRKARLDVDANDMNQEAARRSWDAAEALCAVADAASPTS